MANLRDKILALLSLTTSPNENEAGSAAVQTCRLLRAAIASGDLELREKGSDALDTARGVLDGIPRAAGRGGEWQEMPVRRTGAMTIDEIRTGIRGHAEARREREKKREP